MKKIFKPSKIIGFPICVLAAFLLIYVFNNKLENSFIGYFSYLLSSYGLIIFINYLIDIIKLLSNKISNNYFYKLYKDNYSIFFKYQTIISFIMSLIYFIFKTYLGIKTNSYWLITLGIYYLVLCIIRFILIKYSKEIDEESYEHKVLKMVGIILLLLNIVLVVMISQIITYEETFTYYYYLIFVMALYDFIIIINSIKNVIKDRKSNNPLIITRNNISLATAMVSMLSLETSMIYTFGNNDYLFRRNATTIFGAVMILINIINSIRMVIKANRNVN